MHFDNYEPIYLQEGGWFSNFAKKTMGVGEAEEGTSTTHRLAAIKKPMALANPIKPVGQGMKAFKSQNTMSALERISQLGTKLPR
jgi:hypothetical protein